MYFDQYYLMLVVPALILSVIAQIMVKSTFARYSRIKSRRGISGAEAAGIILRSRGLQGLTIRHIGGTLSDHYDPSTKTLSLSDAVYGETSIAAIGVAAHESGHALQHAGSYGPLVLRGTLVPVANIGSAAGPYLAIAGLFFGLPILIDLGILLFSAAVLFYLVTLPVEFNASRRAVEAIGTNAILTEEELVGVKRVLSAAAMTYVASALTAVASLLRLVMLSRRRD